MTTVFIVAMTVLVAMKTVFIVYGPGNSWWRRPFSLWKTAHLMEEKPFFRWTTGIYSYSQRMCFVVNETILYNNPLSWSGKEGKTVLSPRLTRNRIKTDPIKIWLIRSVLLRSRIKCGDKEILTHLPDSFSELHRKRSCFYIRSIPFNHTGESLFCTR